MGKREKKENKEKLPKIRKEKKKVPEILSVRLSKYEISISLSQNFPVITVLSPLGSPRKTILNLRVIHLSIK